MKRDKTERDTDYHQQFDSLTKANSLMLLSREATDHKEIEDDSNIMTSNSNSSPSSQSRVFECKTCNRQFTSFQALGGHRASHKKPRLMGSENQYSQGSDPVTKHKTHECTICGLEFSIGQALGGHMRRHRASSMNQKFFRSFNGSNSQVVVPVLKKSDHKSRRVLFLDLNLTPLENDIQILQLGMERFPIIS